MDGICDGHTFVYLAGLPMTMNDDYINGFFSGAAMIIIIVIIIGISSCVATRGMDDVRIMRYPTTGEDCIIDERAVEGSTAGEKEEVIIRCY